jgi:hypothetical protein
MRGTSSQPALLFTENETNARRLFDAPERNSIREGCVPRRRHRWSPRRGQPALTGTKAALHFTVELPARGTSVIRLRLCDAGEPASLPTDWFGHAFDDALQQRRADADDFYTATIPAHVTEMRVT